MWNLLRSGGSALVEALLPAQCVTCAVSTASRPRGAVVPGLRWCDAVLLCEACRERALSARPFTHLFEDGDDRLTAAAGTATRAELVEVVSAWKYRGCRGLSWPLARLADEGWRAVVEVGGDVEALVPLPLHPGRRRERGFNQAEILARLIGKGRGVRVETGLLRRVKATVQQAQLPSESLERGRNVAGAFTAVPAGRAERMRLGLIDDIVTSGATAMAAASCLRRAGWSVAWVLAAGMTRPGGAGCLTAAEALSTISIADHGTRDSEEGVTR